MAAVRGPQYPTPKWAEGAMEDGDEGKPLLVIERAKTASAGLSGAEVAVNPSMIGSVQQAKVYLTDAEKETLGLA